MSDDDEKKSREDISTISFKIISITMPHIHNRVLPGKIRERNLQEKNAEKTFWLFSFPEVH